MYEAAFVEMNLAQESLMSLVPRGVIDGVNESMGYETACGVVSALAKVEASVYITAADDVAAVVTPGRGSFTSLESEINNIKDVVKPEVWCSSAAQAYRENFLNAYPDISGIQVSAVEELHAAMKGFGELLEGAYSSLDEVLDNSKTALQSIIDGGNGTEVLGVTFAAISAAVGIAAVGTGPGMGWAIASGGVGVAAAALGSGGGNSTAIIDNVRASAATLQERIDDFDAELAGALGDNIGVIDGLLNVSPGGESDPIEIPRPAFADDPSIL